MAIEAIQQGEVEQVALFASGQIDARQLLDNLLVAKVTAIAPLIGTRDAELLAQDLRVLLDEGSEAA